MIKKMKVYLPIIAASIFIASCTGKKELSDAYGNFEVEDVIISAEANGKLLNFEVEEGKSLSAGKLVGFIDTTSLSLKKEQLFAQKIAIASNIENIQSQITIQEQMKKNLLRDKARIEKLLKDGAATQKQLDDINGQIDVIDQNMASIKTQKNVIIAELAVLKTQIAQVEESITKCKIVNPITGIVLERYAMQNEITAFGKPLYKIADMNEIILRVYISGAQLPNVNIGNEVEVLVDEDEKLNRKLSGVVSWVSESAEFTPKIIQTKEERVNMVYAVKVRVKNDGSLKIGMPGEVNF